MRDEMETTAPRRVAAALGLARVVATAQGASDLARGVLKTLVEGTEVDGAALMLYDPPASGQLIVRDTLGFDAERAAALARHLGPRGRKDAVPRRVEEGTPPRATLCLPLTTERATVGWLLLAPAPEDSAEWFWQEVAAITARTLERSGEGQSPPPSGVFAEVSQAESEAISFLAHEMRTPLTAIKGYSTALLMEEAHFDAATRREFLQFIDEECDVLQELIRDLLESSRLDAGGVSIEPEPVSLPHLAYSVVEDVSRRASRHRFLVDFPDDFPVINADPDRIRQALRNLLDNAVKYSPGGGLTVVRGTVQEDEVLVSVADQGIGIAPEHLNRLFEKFFRVRGETGERTVGTGLGLPIVQAIIEAHGGRLWAQSQLNQGSTFSFTLPLDSPERRERGGQG